MSDTPRTDAAIARMNGYPLVGVTSTRSVGCFVEYARQLERELNEKQRLLNACIESIRNLVDRANAQQSED